MARKTVRVEKVTPANAVADAIRTRRSALELSLSELAAASGVSATMLSAVERGRKSPTIRVLSHVAEALGCSISELLAEPSPARLRIVRANSRKRIVDPETGIERVAFGGLTRHDGADLILYRLPPGTDTGAFAPHRDGVVEHVVVVRGTVEVHVGDAVATLVADDSVSYAGNASHRYRNPGRGAAELVLIVEGSGPRHSSGGRGHARGGGHAR